MECQTLIIGAGIIGVSSALHLQARGRQVLLLDRGPPGSGTSHGNAGLIERSSVVPYAFPRDLGSVLRYACNRQPDVRYSWRELPRLAPWLWRYWQASAPRQLAQATRAMQPLIQQCVSEHDALAAAAGMEHLFRADGWVEIFRDPRAWRRAEAEAARQHEHRLAYRVLDSAALRQLEPGLSGQAIGAVHWLDPKTVADPGALTRGYCQLFSGRGGAFLQADAQALRPEAARWRLETSSGPVHADEVVIAMGAQSRRLLEPLGQVLPLRSKRGYHLHYRNASQPPLQHALCDSQAGFVLAPMTQGVRLTTGIEFASDHAPANEIQLQRCEAIARTLLPLGERIDAEPWLGLRPCLPDMRPALGASRHRGLWLNFGHAHHGLTLGPVCGRLLAELMTGEHPMTDPAPYNPQRFDQRPG